jgi:periplasmic divalent cation tolerance protein
MESDAIVVFITAPSKETARRIARHLVQNRLAACVNIIDPIESIYLWNEKLTEEPETLMMVKTRRALFEDRLVPAVRAIHPYQVPEIIAVPVGPGLAEYLGWIEAATRPEAGLATGG